MIIIIIVDYTSFFSIVNQPNMRTMPFITLSDRRLGSRLVTFFNINLTTFIMQQDECDRTTKMPILAGIVEKEKAADTKGIRPLCTIINRFFIYIC